MQLKLMKLKDVHLCLDFMPSKFKTIVKADLGQQAASQKTIKLFKNKRFKNILQRLSKKTKIKTTCLTAEKVL